MLLQEEKYYLRALGDDPRKVSRLETLMAAAWFSGVSVCIYIHCTHILTHPHTCTPTHPHMHTHTRSGCS